MKIAITGHTAGIGKAVYDLLKDKIIINIGSDIILDKDYIGLDINYVLSKKKLQEIVLQYNNTFPKICNILPGPIDTKMSEKFDVPKLAPNNVAKFIKLIIENKNNFWIKEVILTSPILESE